MHRVTAGLIACLMTGLLLGVPLDGAGPLAVHAQETVTRGPVTNLPLPRYVSIRAELANARRGPGLDHRIDWEFVRRGLPVEVTAEYGNWRRVRDSDGLGGWVHHSLLSGVRTGLVTGTGNAPMRAKPRPGADVVAMAEPGVIARLRECDDEWCRVEAGKIRGWIERARIWGVYPGEIID